MFHVDILYQADVCYTVNVLHLACTIFKRFLNFLLFSVDMIWWLICIHVFKPLYVHVALYFIWRRDSTAKGAKKNTSPNVIRLQ